MRCFQPILLAVVLFACAARPAAGQAIEPGVHVSVNAASFRGESNADFGYRGAFGAGLSFAFPVTVDLLFQPEIRYTVKGASSENATIEGISGELHVTSSISYLEIPVLLVYRFDRGERMRPRVFAGPYVARKLDATIEWEPAGGGPRQSDSDDSVVENDYGIVAGAAIELDVAGEGLLIGSRATIGLSDVRDRPDAPLHNLGFELFVGMVLR